jgi:hypothetical protein
MWNLVSAITECGMFLLACPWARSLSRYVAACGGFPWDETAAPKHAVDVTLYWNGVNICGNVWQVVVT